MPKRKEASNKGARANAVQNADDAEWNAFRAGEGVENALDDALLDDRVSETLVDAVLREDGNGESSTAIEDAQRYDEYTEGLLGLASGIIAERRTLLGDAYPFALAGNHLRYIGSKTHVYEFCLAISRLINYATGYYGRAVTVFEQLSGLVMSCFLGSAGQYYHTGYPGSGSAIKAHLPHLNEHMPGEWKLDLETLKEKANDGGVDAVVWKRPDERRDLGVGSLVFVGNSGSGKSWYNRNKHRERPSAELPKILSRPKPRHLHDYLALPFHLYDRQEWVEACDEGGLVLDRIRIAAIAESQDETIWNREVSRLVMTIDEAIQLLDSSPSLAGPVN